MAEENKKDLHKEKKIKPLVFLTGYAWKYDKRLIPLFFAFGIFTALFPYASIYAIRTILTELTHTKNIENILIICGVYLAGVIVICVMLALINNFYLPKIKRIRTEMLIATQKKYITLPVADIENPQIKKKYDMAFSGTSGFSYGVENVYAKMFSFFGRLSSIIMYAAVLSVLNLSIAAVIALNITVTGFFTYKAYRFDGKMWEERAPYNRKNRHITYTMTNPDYGKDIRVYNFSESLIKIFTQNFSKLLGIDRQVERKKLTAGLVDAVLNLIVNASVYAFLILQLIEKRLEIADFLACFMATTSLNAVIKGLIEDAIIIHVQKETASNYFNFMSIKDAEEMGGKLAMPELTKGFTIEFQNVSFSYPDSETLALNKLNLMINGREKLALLGINGAGKTTLIKLLLRLYAPTEGKILLNGVDISEFALSDYYNAFSVVMQDINIFAAPLYENVSLLGAEQTDMKRVEECLVKAGLSEKLKALERGLNTNILKEINVDGMELSGGEKQKLVIARALYHGGQIIIMDEPTSALDALAEHKLYEELALVSEGKTIIYISHRLASTQFCDKILLLDGKCVSEQGTHKDLMAKKGRYFDMFTAQMKYYAENVKKKEERADETA